MNRAVIARENSTQSWLRRAMSSARTHPRALVGVSWIWRRVRAHWDWCGSIPGSWCIRRFGGSASPCPIGRHLRSSARARARGANRHRSPASLTLQREQQVVAQEIVEVARLRSPGRAASFLGGGAPGSRSSALEPPFARSVSTPGPPRSPDERVSKLGFGIVWLRSSCLRPVFGKRAPQICTSFTLGTLGGLGGQLWGIPIEG